MFFLGSIKSKILKKEVLINNNDDDQSKNTTNETTDGTLNNVSIFCIADNLFSKKPTFNESAKTLQIFAQKDIILKPKELKIIHTDEEIYISDFLYNFGTISTKYLGTFLSIEFNNLNERTLNQKIKITLKNLSLFTYRISQGDELGEIIFVTDKKINFQLLNSCQIAFDPLTKTLLRNDSNKRRKSECT